MSQIVLKSQEIFSVVPNLSTMCAGIIEYAYNHLPLSVPVAVHDMLENGEIYELVLEKSSSIETVLGNSGNETHEEEVPCLVIVSYITYKQQAELLRNIAELKELELQGE